MYQDFVQVKGLTGELKLSHKRRGFGWSITTKEIVLQRPNTSYHILLDDVISVISVNKPANNITFEVDEYTSVTTNFSSQYFKIAVTKAKVYTDKGFSERGEMEFLAPLPDSFFQYFAKYTKLTAV